MREPWDMVDEEELLEELLADDLEPCEECAQLGESLREALREDYADATPEELDEALVNILETLAPAESFNFNKALVQAAKGADRAFENPAVAQIAKTALPYAGGAAGTFLAGPVVGTSIGTGLGQAAAGALTARGKPAPAATPPAAAKPPLASGSLAAAKGVGLTQDPIAIKALLSAAFGEHGRKAIDGVPVGAILNLLSTVFAQAAADADELTATRSEPPAYLLDAEGDLRADPVAPGDRASALYATLVRAESEALAEAAGLR